MTGAKTISQSAVNKTMTTELKNSVAAMQVGIERTSRTINTSQEKMRESVSKAMKYWESTIALGQGNMTAMIASSKIMSEGLKELSQQVAESSKANIAQSVSFTKSLMAIKSMTQAVDLQTGFLRRTAEAAVKQNAVLQEASLRLVKQAADPLAAQMKRSTTTLKKL